MKTCKLEKQIGTYGTVRYLAYEDLIETSINGNTVTRLDEIQSPDLEDILIFLNDRGVRSEEIEIALDEMDKNDHNKAGFGRLGRFVSSWFEGLMH